MKREMWGRKNITIIVLLIISVFLMLAASFYSPQRIYYLVYIGVPVILIAVYLIGYGDNYLFKGLPIISYYAFAIAAERHFLKYEFDGTLDGFFVMEYVFIFCCFLELINLIRIPFVVRDSKDVWVNYCVCAFMLLNAKDLCLWLRMALDSGCYYRAFEFYGCLCFVISSAFIIMPDCLALNIKRIKKKRILFMFIIVISLVASIADYYREANKLEPAVIATMTFIFTFMNSSVLYSIWMLYSAFCEVLKKGPLDAYRCIYLEEQLRYDERTEYDPIEYRNKDFLSEYVGSRYIYRSDIASRIGEIQEDLVRIQNEIEEITSKLDECSIKMREFKRIRLKSLCIQQFDLLTELNYSYGLYIDIPNFVSSKKLSQIIKRLKRSD